MYGFGDEWPPKSDSVQLMKELVVDYIEGLTQQAILVSETTGKLDKECFVYLTRKDRKKFNRIHQLLVTNEEIKSELKYHDMNDQFPSGSSASVPNHGSS